MKLSLNWLKSFFATDFDDALVFAQLTEAGIEIENIHPVTPNFTKVIVAEVISCIPHSNADKLKICEVKIGNAQANLQIICGASNVSSGIKVPCAQIGATLINDFVITQRKVRGIDSYGMLCSGSELGIADQTDGLLILPTDAVVGMDLRSYLDLDDSIVEFKITPNRGDCLSIKGLVREIAALTNYPLKNIISEQNLIPDSAEQCTIEILNQTACPNYNCLIIRKLNNQIKTPNYIVNILIRSGIRSINLVVDITNYVMLLTGQPLHAFDYDILGSKVIIRNSLIDEEIILLNGNKLNLNPNSLLICDVNNKAVAIAGVMGGIDSGTRIDSTNIMLEAAFFDHTTISQQNYGLNSDSAYRYARGVDPHITKDAILLAAKLIKQYTGAKVATVNSVNHLDDQPLTINLNKNFIAKFSGVEELQGENFLKKLGFKIMTNGEELLITVPSHRFDIKTKEDLVGEIIRVHGYDKVIAIAPIASYNLLNIDTYCELYDTKQRLATLGYNEIIAYAFIEEKQAQIFNFHGLTSLLSLNNHIAGLSYLRVSLIQDLIKALIININRGHQSIRLFTTGRVFYSENLDSYQQTQPEMLAGLLYGNYYETKNQTRINDFYDLKHDLINLLGTADIEFDATFSNIDTIKFLHPVRSASLKLNHQVVGFIGQIHPLVAKDLGLEFVPYVFEINTTVFLANKQSKLIPVSHYQKVSRDYCFLLAQELEVGTIVDLLYQQNIRFLLKINVFDVYHDDKLATNKKSVAFNLILQSVDHSLTENEIKEFNQQVEQFFLKNNCELRGL